MDRSNPLQRGTADRGLSSVADTETHHVDERRLVEQIRKSFRENWMVAEIEASEAVNNGVPLRQVWESGKWDHPQLRYIFLRHYIQAFVDAYLSNEELLQQILKQEREYQRLIKVSGQRWQARRIERYLEALQEQELKMFLEEIEYIRRLETVERAKQVVGVHPAKVKSSIFRMGVTAEPIYEPFKPVLPYVSIAMDFVPAAGLLKGIAEAALGRDLLTGEELPLWARVVGAGLSFLPFAKGVFSMAKGGIRIVSRADREGIRRLAALAYLLRDKVEPRQLYQLTKQLSAVSEESLSVAARIPADRALTAGQKAAVADIVRIVDAPAGDATRLSRSASGVIEGGRVLEKAESGTMLPKAVASLKTTAKTAPKIVQELVAKGYLPEAIDALQTAGVEITRKLVNRLDKLGETGAQFCNLFYRSHGWYLVLKGLAAKGHKIPEGAKFVMRYATSHPDIVAKAKADPFLIAFEWGVGTGKKTEKGREHLAREVDIVVRGDRTIGEGNTIYRELKNWTAGTLKNRVTGKNIAHQFIRDVALFDPGNIRWVFNSTKIPEKKEIIDAFIRVIETDPYLTKIWGKDPDLIRSALDRVIEVYP
jgi:hypothetical protein